MAHGFYTSIPGSIPSTVCDAQTLRVTPKHLDPRVVVFFKSEFYSVFGLPTYQIGLVSPFTILNFD